MFGEARAQYGAQRRDRQRTAPVRRRFRLTPKSAKKGGASGWLSKTLHFVQELPRQLWSSAQEQKVRPVESEHEEEEEMEEESDAESPRRRSPMRGVFGVGRGYDEEFEEEFEEDSEDESLDESMRTASRSPIRAHRSPPQPIDAHRPAKRSRTTNQRSFLFDAAYKGKPISRMSRLEILGHLEDIGLPLHGTDNDLSLRLRNYIMSHPSPQHSPEREQEEDTSINDFVTKVRGAWASDSKETDGDKFLEALLRSLKKDSPKKEQHREETAEKESIERMRRAEAPVAHSFNELLDKGLLPNFSKALNNIVKQPTRTRETPLLKKTKARTQEATPVRSSFQQTPPRSPLRAKDWGTPHSPMQQSGFKMPRSPSPTSNKRRARSPSPPTPKALSPKAFSFKKPGTNLSAPVSSPKKASLPETGECPDCGHDLEDVDHSECTMDGEADDIPSSAFNVGSSTTSSWTAPTSKPSFDFGGSFQSKSKGGSSPIAEDAALKTPSFDFKAPQDSAPAPAFSFSMSKPAAEETSSTASPSSSPKAGTSDKGSNNGFSFGGTEKKQDEPSGFSFGGAEKKQDKPSGFSFGSVEKKQDNASSFSFESTEKKQDKPSGFSLGSMEKKDSASGFPFTSSEKKQDSTSGFPVAPAKDGGTEKPAFAFPSSTPASSADTDNKTETAPAFQFPSQTKDTEPSAASGNAPGGFQFPSTTSKPAENTDGATSGTPAFSFNAPKPSESSFSFPQSSSTANASGSAAAPPSTGFSFNAGTSATTAPSANPFDTPSKDASSGLSFGAPTGNAGTSSGFGASSGTLSSSGLGASNGVASSGFGSPAPTAYGFGTSAAPSSGFGAPSPGFGAPSSGFGPTPASAGFGSTPAPSSFGGSTSSFGAGSSGFGASTPSFGQAPTVNTTQPFSPPTSGGFKIGNQSTGEKRTFYKAKRPR